MNRLLAAIGVGVALASGALPAQTTPAPRTDARGGGSAQPGIDVLHYDVALELPDTGAFLRGDVTVHLRRAGGVSRLRLDLVDGLRVRAVSVDGRAVAAVHRGDVLDVPLAESGDSTAVRVTYDGVVRDGLVVRRDPRGRWTWFGDNWPDRARQWLPTVDHPSDKATVDWAVRAPTGRTVVANGELVGIRRLAGRDAGRSETRWRETRPVPTYVMVVAAGPLVRFDLREPDCHYGDRGQCVRQSVYVLPENRDWLPGPFLAAGPILSLFERLVGPFPYEKLAHLQSATRFGGMENASAIFYASALFTTRTLGDGLIAHETAHQWFGDAVTEASWAHLWLSEGFATYFAALWTQYIRGDAAFRREMAEMRRRILSDSIVATRPVIDTTEQDYLKLLNTNSYQKGAYVLHLLREQVGDSAFLAGVRSYYARYRHGTALTDDLRREVETASRQQLGPFFDQWLRRSGLPSLEVGWAHDPRSGLLTVFVRQDSVRGPYELPLVVRITDASGAVHREVAQIPASPRVVIPLAWRGAGRPRAVVFDPDSTLLGRLTGL